MLQSMGSKRVRHDLETEQQSTFLPRAKEMLVDPTSRKQGSH